MHHLSCHQHPLGCPFQQEEMKSNCRAQPSQYTARNWETEAMKKVHGAEL